MKQSIKRSSIWRIVTGLLAATAIASVTVGGCATSDDDANAITPGNGDDAGACPIGQTSCKDVCVDTNKDRTNCGGCGSLCAPGNVCSSGKCVLSCPGGLVTCDGTCVNTQGDRLNCGECGVRCEAGEVCSGGRCQLSCQEGLTDCEGNCVDTDKDRDHCGTCGTSCEAGEVCSNGECGLSCQSGLTDCAGFCVNTDSDRQNCGSCGTSCASGEVCSDGECAVSCQSGLTVCSGTCVNTQTDRKHCGSCGTACDPGEVCSAGSCVLSCQEGLSACGGTCVNTQTDRSNCGQCGKVCPSGEVCSNGNCSATCDSGLTNCDGACVNLKTSRGYCGSCAISCSSTQFCDDGACACEPDQTACGNECVDLSTNSNHCGTCDNACGANEVCAANGCVAIANGNGEIGKDGLPKVAMVATASEIALNNVKATLGSLDAFSAMDSVSINGMTPTVEALRDYDAIAFYTSGALADATLMGDNLAAYLEGGGGVVLFSHATWELWKDGSNVGNTLLGKYAADYALLPKQGPVPTSSASLGTIVEPGSPIMKGVDTFKCRSATSCYHLTGSPINAAILVAKWSDGTPLVLRRDFDGRKVVELNFSPGTGSGNWDAATDGATLVKNALLYVLPRIVTAAPRLDLGNVPVFTPAPAKTLVYKNTSAAPQVISNIEVTGAHIGDFAVTPAVALPVTLAPGETLDVGVVFTPSGTGLRAATVSATVNGFATKLTTLLVGKGA